MKNELFNLRVLLASDASIHGHGWNLMKSHGCGPVSFPDLSRHVFSINSRRGIKKSTNFFSQFEFPRNTSNTPSLFDFFSFFFWSLLDVLTSNVPVRCRSKLTVQTFFLKKFAPIPDSIRFQWFPMQKKAISLLIQRQLNAVCWLIIFPCIYILWYFVINWLIIRYTFQRRLY